MVGGLLHGRIRGGIFLISLGMVSCPSTLPEGSGVGRPAKSGYFCGVMYIGDLAFKGLGILGIREFRGLGLLAFWPLWSQEEMVRGELKRDI
jgi:hypothetical protein